MRRRSASAEPNTRLGAIALMIDAMELLAMGRLDGFRLVTSDSGFTRLELYLGEDGLVVYGFGGRTTPEAAHNAFSWILYSENVMEFGTEIGNGGVASAAK